MRGLGQVSTACCAGLPAALCEQAHIGLTSLAIRFGLSGGDPAWLVRSSSITAEMTQSAWLVGCTTGSRRLLAADVDHIPAGADFVAHLNNQVAECDVVLAIIGPNWLRAKDKAGQRRLHQPDDFVAIEIAAALARDTLVIPVLVDAARMPKESDLPDTLKPLARRQAVEVRHAHFGHDAEALIARMRKALGREAAGSGRWSVPLVAVVAATLLLLVGWGGYAFIQKREGVELQRVVALKAEAEAKRKADEGERQRLAALRAEQERQARAVAEADAKRKADEARQQQAAVSAEQERRAKRGPKPVRRP